MEDQVFAAALPPARGLGQLEQPTPPERGQDEIGVLWHGFNAPLRQLRDSIPHPRAGARCRPAPHTNTLSATLAGNPRGGDSTMDPSTIKQRSAFLTTTALGEQQVAWLRSLTGQLLQMARLELPARAGGKDRT